MTRPGVSPPQQGPERGIHPTGVDVGMALREGADLAGSQRNKARTALRVDGAPSDRLRITAIAMPGLRGRRHLIAPATRARCSRWVPVPGQHQRSTWPAPGQYSTGTRTRTSLIAGQHLQLLSTRPASGPGLRSTRTAPGQHLTSISTGRGPNQHQARAWPAPLPRLPGCWAGPAAGTAN